MKRFLLFALILLLTSLACGSTAPTALPQATDRSTSIPADAVKQTPETDLYPPKSETGEQEPVNLKIVNSIYSDGWPFTTQDGNELWFTRSVGAPELWRSKRVNGVWTEPQKMFGPFAGEASLDNDGNVYFTHHFFKDNVMLEADIYIAIKYKAVP